MVAAAPASKWPSTPSRRADRRSQSKTTPNATPSTPRASSGRRASRNRRGHGTGFGGVAAVLFADPQRVTLADVWELGAASGTEDSYNLLIDLLDPTAALPQVLTNRTIRYQVTVF